jgi:hypothetical protein
LGSLVFQLPEASFRASSALCLDVCTYKSWYFTPDFDFARVYFISFIDDATRYCYLYLVKTKDEALHCFKVYKAEVENQLEKKIK